LYQTTKAPAVATEIVSHFIFQKTDLPGLATICYRLPITTTLGRL
jgi:hypothetical protein